MNDYCPYCGGLLQKGYMQSPRPISWTPRKLKIFTHHAFCNDSTCVLSEGSLLKAPCVIAYKCDKCKKVIIDFENNKIE